MEPEQQQLPQHIEHIRTRVDIGFKKVHNSTGTYGARTYSSLGYDNSLTVEKFRDQVRFEITSCTDEEVVFDIINIDAPLANALRRILLVEVPTIAIENVFIHDNSSIMHDEMLAHRLGLVPLRVDPRPFSIWNKGDPVTSENTVQFKLKVSCSFNPSIPRDGEAPPDILYRNAKVTSGMIKYEPFPDASQHHLFGDQPPAPVHEDIVVCKLRPGQELDISLHATKNIGKEHAKWSPVSTAAYRMLPEVKLKKELRGNDAKELVQMCPAKVFDIEDDRAIVARPRDCTMCRECIRVSPWDERVQLTRKRDQFIFDVESAGGLPAATLITEGLDVLMQKCDTLLANVDDALKRRATYEEEPPNEQINDAVVPMTDE